VWLDSGRLVCVCRSLALPLSVQALTRPPSACCWSTRTRTQELALGELSHADLLEATRTDERSTREELRCVLAVVRHGDRCARVLVCVGVVGPAGDVLPGRPHTHMVLLTACSTAPLLPTKHT
jgi:hypothetical protein